MLDIGTRIMLESQSLHSLNHNDRASRNYSNYLESPARFLPGKYTNL